MNKEKKRVSIWRMLELPAAPPCTIHMSKEERNEEICLMLK
jgi:hypothetical protein